MYNGKIKTPLNKTKQFQLTVNGQTGSMNLMESVPNHVKEEVE